MTTPEDTELREKLILIRYPDGIEPTNGSTVSDMVRHAQEKHIDGLLNLITLHTQKAKLNTAKDIQKLAEKYDENDPIVDLDSWAVPYGSITNYIAHLTNPTEAGEE